VKNVAAGKLEWCWREISVEFVWEKKGGPMKKAKKKVYHGTDVNELSLAVV
jgi:hypothetical protein